MYIYGKNVAKETLESNNKIVKAIICEDFNDQDLILAIGETYVKLISNRIGSTFRDTEVELELKYKMIKVIILKRTNSDIYEKALENVLEFQKNIEDKILDKEFIEEMNEEMKN